MSSRRYGLLLNGSSVAVMALTPVMNKWSMFTLSPLAASFYNALISLVLTLITIAMTKTKMVWIKQPVVWILGLTNCLGIFLQYLSLFFLDPVSVGLIGRFYIVFAILLSVLMLHEKFDRRELVPILLCIAGTALVSDFSENVNNIIGLVCAFGYTFSFALTNTLAKKALTQVDEKILLLYNQGTAVVILGLILAGSGKLSFSPNMGMGAVAISAFCSGFLGLLLFYRGLKFISFRDANLIRALNPIFVLVYSLPFFTIQITPAFLLGGALIVLSIVWMSLPVKKSQID
ncbi:DMT family transporter [Lacticaseibacillus parahuelsenbergensis]|uniref:DMT family transporter n=1 Tax=Lacticaseibacillus parahuelsenbergensis TaxID=3068305 RepID=A0ABY9L3I6_9LACO|nr:MULTISPECIES: DMT family transporter [Lacticaseibacillus]MDE3281241.1 DMT family transporter [Lacticaseibacillus casei]WLV78167.1 DMT family transporter [Lacticaseibacillus sp. NCIMB 15471]